MHDRIHVVIDWREVKNHRLKWSETSARRLGNFPSSCPKRAQCVKCEPPAGECLRCISATLQCFAWNVYAKHSSAFSFTNTAHATLKQLYCWWPCRKRAEICPKWLSVPETFFCTGGFFSNFATILKLVWPEKMNLLNFEKLYFNKNKHNFPPTKTGSAHSKDTEKTNIPPVALIGGRLEIKIVSCLKLVVLRSTEVN